MAISGKPGLYKMVSQTKNGLIVEGLDDKKRFPVYSANQISALEEISIYTITEDFPLAKVLTNIYKHANGGETISPKASKEELMSFFGEILPDFDDEKVYPSDVKKIVQWYSTLLRHGIIDGVEDAEIVEVQAVEPTEEVQ